MFNNNTSFSFQSVGDGFIDFIRAQDKESPALENALDFVTSSMFLSSFGSSQVIDLVNALISEYPKRSFSLERLIRSLISSPLFPRISDLINKLPDDLSAKLGAECCKKINAFTLTEDGITNQNPENFPQMNFKSPLISISEVYNEKMVDNNQNFSQFLEQFRPFEFDVADVADFISNLVSPNFEKEPTSDRNISSSLRHFKNQSKIQIDKLISKFDRKSIVIHSSAAFQTFITCIKDVTNSRTIPVAPFLGKWKHPLTQLNFLMHIVKANPIPVVFPKPAPINKLNAVIIGDFKNDIWRCYDFIDTLSYLYNHNETDVDLILEKSIGKGPALLLLVLSQNSNISRFATHLTRILLHSQNQYMPGFSALWATNEDFMVNLFETLYEEQRTLLGRFLDVIDDLAIFDVFIQKCSLKMSILLRFTAFFRRGYNFQNDLLELYNKDNETINICFNIVENPAEFGFIIDHTERKLSTGEIVTSDLVFFRFINEIYQNIDSTLQQRINSLFDKCITRSSDLTGYNFYWRKKKEPPQSPKSPTLAKERDYIELAIGTDPTSISRYNITVKRLISEIPQDKNTAISNGHTLGKLLAQDLLSHQYTAQALELIDKGIKMNENTSGFGFAIACLEELKNDFDLFLPFSNHIKDLKNFQESAPALYNSVKKACEIKPSLFIYKYEEKRTLKVPLCLQRFSNLKLYINPMTQINNPIKDQSYIDAKSLSLIKMEQFSKITSDIQDNSVEAAIFMIYELLNDTSSSRSLKTRCTLMKLGMWIGYHTYCVKKPILINLLDVPNLLLYGYSNSLLCSIIPFVYYLLRDAADIFNPPNPWTISVLSILCGIIRIPYLKNSLSYYIMRIFSSFKVNLNEIEPYPLHRLKTHPILTADFLYPPFDFTTSLSSSTPKNIMNGDMMSLFKIIHLHLHLRTEWEPFRSALTWEIGNFIYTKVSSIANTAATTSFDLVLKDFARCNDEEVVSRNANALLHQFTSSLSMMAVSLTNESYEIPSDNIRRSIIRTNMRWIDLVVRQLSFSLGSQILTQKLKPIQNVRSNRTLTLQTNESTPDNNSNENDGYDNFDHEYSYWDVKSFPPVIAQKLPPALWPQEIQSSTFSRKIDSSSISPTGLYECFNVDFDIKRAYGSLNINPFSICPPADFRIDNHLASWILGNLLSDEKTGIINGIHKQGQIPINNTDPVLIISTIIYCFPPGISQIAGKFGAELVYSIFHTFQGKESLEKLILPYLMFTSPDFNVLIQMVSLGLVLVENIEKIVMNFIDHSFKTDINFEPLVIFLMDTLKSDKQSIKYFERLLPFLSSYNQKGYPYEDLHKMWQNYIWSHYDKEKITIPPIKDANGSFLYDCEQAIASQTFDKFLYEKQSKGGSSEFWKQLLVTSYPDGKDRLLKIIYFILFMQQNEISSSLQDFMKEIFLVTCNNFISMEFFASVMGNIFLTLRNLNKQVSQMLGGFLNDITPNKYPNFASAWLYLFPLALQIFLLQDDFFPPTSLLVTAMLGIFKMFPKNWGQLPLYRKYYKSVLRIMLLIIHDCPKFVCGYYHDFLSEIPLSFRRLRSIILCCKINNQLIEPPILHKFLQPTQSKYKSMFQNQNNELSKELMKWCSTGQLQISNISEFLIYSFYNNDDYRDFKITNHPLFRIILEMLKSVYSIMDATTILEAIFDHLRFESNATIFFSEVLFHLFVHANLNWDFIPIQTILFNILMQRSEGINPIPFGVRKLKDLLADQPKYQDFYAIYIQNISK